MSDIWDVREGDCLEGMRAMAPNSVDAIVCDPPYGLAFMGKDWDHGIPGVAFWDAALRVAKPGAHLVAFGGTRTFHRLACAIEDAGWEIRDTLMWLYGSGFPKSLDVSKAMDKVNGETDRLHRFTAWMRTTGLTARRLDEVTDSAMGGHYLTAKSQPAIPTPELWARIRPLVAEVPAWVDELVKRIAAEREVVGEHENPAASIYGTGMDRDIVPITAPATDLARQWSGWGTALKPAWEPILLARKPLAGTVAATVAAYGTGAMNIDGCRIACTDKTKFPVGYGRGFGETYAGDDYSRAQERTEDGNPAGRWPANVVLDEAAAALLDAQSGERKAGKFVVGGPPRTTSAHIGQISGQPRTDAVMNYGDTGGASRFFYTSKASRREREAGLEGMPRQSCDNWPQSLDGDDVRGASPRTNNHPTVKPLALMRWLCRLVTPPGGLILDPFAGSGSTGCAAVLEGFRFLGLEREPEYVAIARRRLAHWHAEAQAIAEAAASPERGADRRRHPTRQRAGERRQPAVPEPTLELEIPAA